MFGNLTENIRKAGKSSLVKRNRRLKSIDIQ